MLRVHIRFLNTFQKIGNNLPRVFLNLRQFLLEDAIKLLFPEAWEMFNEAMQRKAQATSRQQKNIRRKLAFENHREIKRQTRSMTVRRAAKEYGCL